MVSGEKFLADWQVGKVFAAASQRARDLCGANGAMVRPQDVGGPQPLSPTDEMLPSQLPADSRAQPFCQRECHRSRLIHSSEISLLLVGSGLFKMKS